MSRIGKIRQEIESRKRRWMFDDLPISIGRYYEDRDILEFIDSLPDEHSYDTQKYTPIPSVSIEDVARVQFASHAHVFDRKRKAVLDWEQFKEVASIFYGFGKRDSLPEEKPSEDLEEAADKFEQEYFTDTTIGEAFIEGAKWQKEQMMNNGTVILAEEDFDAEKEKASEWGYNLCKEQMMKEAVDYTAAFEGQWKENPLLKPQCKDCSYFIDLSPDEGACSKPMGGRNGVWGDEEICDDFEWDE